MPRGGDPKSRDQLIQMLVANACCDGNLLLSWGPQWNGEFESIGKATFRVKEVLEK